MLRRDLFSSCYVQKAVGMMETCILSAGYESLSTGDPFTTTRVGVGYKK